MIMIFSTSADLEGKVYKSACGAESLEAALDFLNELVAQGDTLLDAYIIDQAAPQKRLNLPLEAFDGAPFTVALKELKEEWDIVLNESYPGSLTHDKAMIDLLEQRINQYRSCIAGFERMIKCFTTLLQRTQSTALTGPLQDSLIRRYELILARSQRQLVNTKLRSALVANRLSQLAG